MEQFNHFVFALNNRLQHQPLERRQTLMKKVLDDVVVLSDGSESHIFTPLSQLCTNEDWEEERESIASENAIAREERIRALQAFYNVQGDEWDDDESEREREHAVKKRCGKTDLHEAVLMGDLDLIRKLIADGVDIHAKNNNGQTAIYLAYLEENEAIINLFVELGVVKSNAA